MDNKVMDSISSILKQEGYGNVTRHKSSTSQTLSADQGELKVVVHITKQSATPSNHAMPVNNSLKNRDVAVRAGLPGLSGAIGNEALQRLQQGGAKLSAPWTDTERSRN